MSFPPQNTNFDDRFLMLSEDATVQGTSNPPLPFHTPRQNAIIYKNLSHLPTPCSGFAIIQGLVLHPRVFELRHAAQVETGRMWLFEQQQALAFSNVTTNIRMTVIRLSSGGLWVHAPIAPTQ